jgi:hypothetical protein
MPPHANYPTRQEKAERDAAVVRLRLSRPDLTWNQIGSQVNLSARACKKIWKAWGETEKDGMVEASPVELLFEHIYGLRLVRGQLHQAAQAAEKDHNQAARIAALKSIAELRLQEMRLLQNTGLLPSNLRSVRTELDYRFLLDQILEILVSSNVGEAVLGEINRIAGERATASRSRVTLELVPGNEVFDVEDDEVEEEDG